MLWKISADHSLCWKMWRQKCQEKPTRIVELYLELIRGTLNGDKCMLTPILFEYNWLNPNTATFPVEGVHSCATS